MVLRQPYQKKEMMHGTAAGAAAREATPDELTSVLLGKATEKQAGDHPGWGPKQRRAAHVLGVLVESGGLVAEGGALRDLIAAWLSTDQAGGVAAPKDLDVYPCKATVE